MNLILFGLLSIIPDLISCVSYYQLLGVSETASQQEIRQAYKKLAVKYHPDKNPNESDRLKFLEISEAYDTLKNPWKRRTYDYTDHTQSRSQDQNRQDLFSNGLYKDDPYVVTVTPEQYDSFLADGFHFVNFYSPFCPPCQKLVRHWKALAEAYHGIVKFGAVNCKYHSSFCYNVMRISSYPSLLFYPEGSSGSYFYYSGGRSFDEITSFVTSHLTRRAPLVKTTRVSISPALFILKRDRFTNEALMRITYKLKDVLPVLLLESSSSKWSDDVTCVISLSQFIEVTSDTEAEVISAVQQHMDGFTHVSQEMFTEIRTRLRSKSESPWVLYFTDGPIDNILLHKTNNTVKGINIGSISCLEYSGLCQSLQVSSYPRVGILHTSGAFSLIPIDDVIGHVARRAHMQNLHSLSHTEVHRIINEGDTENWIVFTIPAWSKDSHDRLITKIAQKYNSMQVGVWRCDRGDSSCRTSGVWARYRTRPYSLSGSLDYDQIVQFIDGIRNTPDVEVDEEQVLAVMQGTKPQSWVLVMTAAGDAHADTLAHHWRLTAQKLSPLKDLRIGILQCRSSTGLCSNIRSSMVRYYPPKSTYTSAVSANELPSWAYMCEWAVSRLVVVDMMTYTSFTRQVLSDQLHSAGSNRPWLVYFHSPRCYSCYLHYADFVIAAQHLKPAVRIAKVNCLAERELCSREYINSYPSIRLYLSNRHRAQETHSIQTGDHHTLVEYIKRHIIKYDKSLLSGVEGFGTLVHDEF